MSSSKIAFEQLKRRLGRLTVEHVRYSGIYVDDPDFLVILSWEGQEAAVYGGYIIEVEEAEDAILFRASQLLECSMVDPIMNKCTARFVCEHGSVQFKYDEENFTYGVARTAER